MKEGKNRKNERKSKTEIMKKGKNRKNEREQNGKNERGQKQKE